MKNDDNIKITCPLCDYAFYESRCWVINNDLMYCGNCTQVFNVHDINLKKDEAYVCDDEF